MLRTGLDARFGACRTTARALLHSDEVTGQHSPALDNLMGTAALLASAAAALYFLATGVKKPRAKADEKKPVKSETQPPSPAPEEQRVAGM
jgi:hypothetical protein